MRKVLYIYIYIFSLTIQISPVKYRFSLSFILILCLTRVAGLGKEKKIETIISFNDEEGGAKEMKLTFFYQFCKDIMSLKRFEKDKKITQKQCEL